MLDSIVLLKMFTLWLCWAVRAERETGLTGQVGLGRDDSRRKEKQMSYQAELLKQASHSSSHGDTDYSTTNYCCSMQYMCFIISHSSTTMIMWQHVCVSYGYNALFIPEMFHRTTTVLRYCNVGISVRLHIGRGCKSVQF